jgi:hypothetical protein
MEDRFNGEVQGISRQEEEREEGLEGGLIDPSEPDSPDLENLSLIEQVAAIAAANARAPLDNEKSLTLFLKSWWSRTYNKPLKDPLLESYTLEELLYEFYDKIERAKAAEETIEQENDRIEEAKEKKVLDWAEQEEKREMEEEMRKQASNPAQDPNNIKWMEEQIAAAKEIYGTNFGEDIEDSFE